MRRNDFYSFIPMRKPEECCWLAYEQMSDHPSPMTTQHMSSVWLMMCAAMCLPSFSCNKVSCKFHIGVIGRLTGTFFQILLKGSLNKYV